jgi:hypothetical protein
MSLIFKALQRSRRTVRGDSAETERTVRKRNTLGWRRLLVIPPAAALAGALLFFSGLWTAQWVTSASSPPSAMAASAGAAQAHDEADGGTYAIVEPKDTADGKAPAADTGPGGAESFRDGRDERFQFFPADSRKPGGSPDEIAADHSSGESRLAEIAVFHPDAEQSSRETPRHPGTVAPETVRPSGPAADGGIIGGASGEHGEESGLKNHPPPAMIADKIDPLRERQAEQARSHLAVSRLANRLRGAIRSGERERVRELLDQLAGIKGRDHLFVRKLEAYALINQGDLKGAHDLLEAVLAFRPDDFEAGLNMAVVDMRSGRIDQARERLKSLLDRYPEKDQVVRYLRQLER